MSGMEWEVTRCDLLRDGGSFEVELRPLGAPTGRYLELPVKRWDHPSQIDWDPLELDGKPLTASEELTWLRRLESSRRSSEWEEALSEVIGILNSRNSA